MSAGDRQMPAPPDGVRPGQVGLVCVGRVILGDVAATLVDLAIRGHLDVGLRSRGGTADWLLTPRLVTAPSRGAGELLGYERVLLGRLAGQGGPVSLPDLPRSVLDETRSELIEDAVRRGWFLGHPRHHATSKAATALAGCVLAFRRDLLHLESGRRGSGGLLPYALHFGMAGHDEPLARFAQAFGDRFGGLEGWHLPVPERPDDIDDLDIWLGPWSANEQQ